MTPAELQFSGRAIYGERWQSALARALGVNDRTVRKWLHGDRPIPQPTAIAIRALAANAAAARHRRDG